MLPSPENDYISISLTNQGGTSRYFDYPHTTRGSSRYFDKKDSITNSHTKCRGTGTTKLYTSINKKTYQGGSSDTIITYWGCGSWVIPEMINQVISEYIK